MEGQPQAFCRAEIVIPHTLPAGRPHITSIVVQANSLGELNAKMARGENAAFEKGRGTHINYGARFVLNPETGEYEAVDAVSAAVRGAIIGVGRFIRGLTYGA